LTIFFVNKNFLRKKNSSLRAYALRSTYSAGQPVSQSDRLQSLSRNEWLFRGSSQGLDGELSSAWPRQNGSPATKGRNWG